MVLHKIHTILIIQYKHIIPYIILDRHRHLLLLSFLFMPNV